MKSIIGLIASVLVLAGVIVTVADYTPVTAGYAGTISAAQTFSGAVTASSTVTTSGVRVDTPTALTVTNGQAITVSAGTYVLSGGGGANDTTNTVTVAAGTIGTKVLFIVDAASTNLVNFADSGNLALSGAALLDNNDTLELSAVTAANWVEVSQSNN